MNAWLSGEVGQRGSLQNCYAPVRSRPEPPSSSGGTGIRARLKIVSRKGCGFDSHLEHYWKLKVQSEKLKIKEFKFLFYNFLC